MIEKYSIDDNIEFELISQQSDLFKDEQFPPEITSLIDFEDKILSNSDKLKWTSYEWKSLRITYKEVFLLNNVSCKDVIQGSLGNCYFLSVCAVMAEFPHRLSKIFLIKKINNAGIYAVRFFIDGEVKKIIVDDLIPFDTYSNRPAFTKFPQSKNIWSIVMEKAWAKFLGNYQRTISGVPNDVFSIMTGAPTQHFSTKKFKETDEIKNKKWKELREYFLKDYLICSSTHSEYFYEKYYDKDVNFQLQEHIKTIEEMISLGLVTNHAYSVLLCHEEMIGDEEVRLIKIRNPWGVLNHKKLKFDSILIKKPKYQSILTQFGQFEEGVFILTYEEFLKYFSDIYICKYMDNYNVTSRLLFQDQNNYNHFFAFKLTLSEDVNKIFFTAAKSTRLLFCQNEEGRVINEMCSSIWLGSFNNKNKLNYMSHAEGFDSFLTIEIDFLSKGDYYLLVHIDHYQTNLIEKYFLGSLQVYTDNDKFTIEAYNLDENFLLFSDLCHSYYYNLNKKFDHKKFLTEDKLIYSDSMAFPHSSYSFIIFENHKKDEKILMDVIIEISSALGFESIILKEKSLNYSNFELSCGENLIVPFYKAGFTYKFSYRTYTFLNRSQLMEEVRKSGQIYIINLEDREVFYYFYKHKTGMVFRFTNYSEVFLNIHLQITEIFNLFCSEEKNYNFELFLEPEAEMFRFYDLIDINQGFQLKWKISGEVQY
jgi:hypothetical protein